MSDDRLQRDDDALLSRLLRAGDADEPSPKAVQRALIAVTAATGAAGTTAGAGAAQLAASSTWFGGSVFKWLGIGALCGVVVGSAGPALLVSDAEPVSILKRGAAGPAQLARAKSPAAPRNTRAQVGVAEHETSGLTQNAPPAPPASRTLAEHSKPTAFEPEAEAAAPVVPTAPSETLKDELLVRERARSAVQRRDAAAAQAAISEYQTRFPRGRLYPELTLLRIDLLAARGDTAGARALAAQFLKANPSSPSAARLKTRFNLPD
ncbi:MAG TPA: hypothetical protein PKD61_16265 [Polyangiaceae bacterium]|nr:hypothetical protein [Polyangiaceae bacterium]